MPFYALDAFKRFVGFVTPQLRLHLLTACRDSPNPIAEICEFLQAAGPDETVVVHRQVRAAVTHAQRAADKEVARLDEQNGLQVELLQELLWSPHHVVQICR